MAGKLALVDVDAEDLLAIAPDLDVGDTGHRGERILDLVFDKHRHVLDRHRVRRDGKPHHGVGIGVRFDDLWRVRLFRQLIGDPADRVPDVGRGDVQVDAVVELDGDATAAERRTGRDRLDAGDTGDGAFNRIRQFAVDSLGRGAFEHRVDGDDGAVDIGQLANLDTVEGGEAGNGDERVEHERQHRTADEQRGKAGFAAFAVELSHRLLRS